MEGNDEERGEGAESRRRLFARSHLCMYVAVRRLSRLGVHTSKCIIRVRGFVQV